MTVLPLWVVRILTVALRTWVEEQGGSGKIADAAVYFGVEPSDIRAAVNLTDGVLKIDGEHVLVR